MQSTVAELAALIGGQLPAEVSGLERIHGVAAAADACPGEITFLGNPKYLADVRSSRATAVLVPVGFAEDIPAIPIQVDRPSLAFSLLVAKFAPVEVPIGAGVHQTAILGRDVVLGEGVSLGAFAVVEDGVRIGKGSAIGAHGYVGHGAEIGSDCQLAPRVTIGSRCRLGDRVIVHSGAVLGSDGFGFEFANGRHVKVPQSGIVQVDDDVEIGANVTIDRARFGRTWIGAGTKIDNLVQIAHNVVIGKHCLVVAQAGISGSSRLGNLVTIAGQVGIVGHIEVGDRATVAAQSGVSKRVAPDSVVFGSPALPMPEAKERLAYLGRLPKLFERVRKLEQPICQPEDSSPSGAKS